MIDKTAPIESYESWIERVLTMSSLSVFHLSEMAECYAPDSRTSPGAEFLNSVYQAWQEADSERRNDCFEDVDLCISPYTHEQWTAFVDLGGYLEEVEGEAPMKTFAALALAQIGERLWFALNTEAE